MENILLPWLVLEMIILIIKFMSCDMSRPCPDCGAPPVLGMAQDPVSAPRSFSPVCSDSAAGRDPRQSPQVPSVLPSQVQTLSSLQPIPRKVPDAQRWDCPSAPSCLHLAGMEEQVLAVMPCLNRSPWAVASSCRALAASGE